MSTEKAYSTNYAMHVDVARFLTKRIAVTGGVAGMGSAGGEDAKNRATGVGAPALYVFAGGLYYFTPQSITSVYLGGSYWQQVTQRSGADTGAAVGTVGLQGAISSRATFFVEGGYGFNVTRGNREELVTRILGRVGIRLKI